MNIYLNNSVDNLPYATDLGTYAARMECFCALVCGSVTGGGRTQLRNKAVKGHQHSRHRWSTDGWGMDIVTDDWKDLDEQNRKDLVLLARRMGIHAVVESSHLHTQNVPPHR